LRLARERGYPLLTILDVAVLIILAAVIGGPLVVMVLRPLAPEIPDNFSFAQLLAALAALVARQLTSDRRIPVTGLLDLLAPAAALYIAIARLGCFASGCCHGKPAWGVPWAVTFHDPHSASIYRGIPVHPTQLYEAAGCFLLFLWLMALRNRPQWRGRLFWLFLGGYGALRFVVEIYRGDVKPMVGELALAQVISIGMVLVSGMMLAWASAKNLRVREESAP
jgi:phosphatidylglycerol:prolipoprotein diacylglycerol transferase